MELKDEKQAVVMEREQNMPDWVRNNARINRNYKITYKIFLDMIGL